MADDEYDLKPLDEPKKNPPAGDAAPAPQTPPGFVPPTPIIEPPDPVPYESGPTEEDREDIEKNKGMAILAYIIFLVPLLVVPKSKFARFHANQGLLVFIFGVTSVFLALILGLGMSLLSHILARFDIPFLGWFLSCIVWLLSVFCIVFSLALAVMGIINAANGESKHLPLFGRYQLLK